MNGNKCILQLRGVRPFLPDKYDLTKHPNYKETAARPTKNPANTDVYWVCTQLVAESKRVLDHTNNKIGGKRLSQIPWTTLWTYDHSLVIFQFFHTGLLFYYDHSVSRSYMSLNILGMGGIFFYLLSQRSHEDTQ